MHHALYLHVTCAFIQSFEALNQRAVAVVVDPIQSVKGKVVIDAFRCAHFFLSHQSAITSSNWYPTVRAACIDLSTRDSYLNVGCDISASCTRFRLASHLHVFHSTQEQES